MPHAIWSGPISFGLVNIPVTLSPATHSRTVSFHQLHAEDGVRVKYVKMCPAHDRVLDQEEIARGYEFEKGSYVVLEEKDFEAAAAMITNSHAIDILRFVDFGDVDPIYLQKAYLLEPEEKSARAYGLLLMAMERNNKAAVARFVLREKQHLALLWVRQGALMLDALYYFDEVIAAAELPVSGASEPDPGELELAEDLIGRMTGEFDLGQYHDEYREKLLEIIQRKIEGEEIVVPEVEELAPVVDIMSALKESIARQEGGAGSESAS